MSMTKKDYELVAWAMIRSRAVVANERAMRFVIDELALQFEEANPKFDRKRFLESCGVEV